ncbi:MAG: hypothetical protein WDW38_008371 [Sanguina aurantia]
MELQGLEQILTWDCNARGLISSQHHLPPVAIFTPQVSFATLEPLLHVASFLEAPALLEVCCQFMREHLSLLNAIPLLMLSSSYGCLQLQTELVTLISREICYFASGSSSQSASRGAGGTRNNNSSSGSDGAVDQSPTGSSSAGRRGCGAAGCGEGCSACNSHHGSLAVTSFLQLPGDLLLDILRSKHLSVDSEAEVMQALVEWVAADITDRAPEAASLMAAVQLSSRAQLLSLQLQCGSQVQTAVLELMYSILSESGALEEESADSEQQQQQQQQQSARPSVDCAPNLGSDVTDALRRSSMGDALGHRAPVSGLLAAGGHDSEWRILRSVEIYDPRRDSWTAGPSLPQGVSFAGCAASPGHQVLLVGGTPLCSQVTSLGHGQDHWTVCPPLMAPRAHAGVAALAGSFYVLGGRSMVAQVQQRSAMAVATLGGRIYAVGGAGLRCVHRSLELFDRGAERWSLLGGELRTARKYTSAAVLGGRLYVVGGLDEVRTRLSSMEAYDPREGKWASMPDMKLPRSSCAAATLAGRLYVVGGSADEDGVHTQVEAWDGVAGRWSMCSAMGSGRSGLGLCSI